MSLVLIAFLMSCATDELIEPEPIDLTSVLGVDEVRAGVVTDEASLWGGVSAEGRIGDIKIYNDRAQFLIQGLRDGHYYVPYGGGVVDADVVRPPGQPGRDVIDEFRVMLGIARLVATQHVEVVSDGLDGEDAVVQVEGHAAPMTLVTGSLEMPDFVPDLDMNVVTQYRLAAGSPLLEITTTVTWLDETTTLQVGDVGWFATDVVDQYNQYAGLADSGMDPGWYGAIGQQNEVAIALMAGEGVFPTTAAQTVLSEFGRFAVGFGEPVTFETGDTLTIHRYLGVANDLAGLTDAWYARRGEAVTEVSGVVEAESGGLAGARVHLVGDDGPLTMAITDDSGNWKASVPQSSTVTAVATGRGSGFWTDLPVGAGWVAPYATDAVNAMALESLRNGAAEIASTRGYGISEVKPVTDEVALTLVEPGRIQVQIADGGSAVVRVDFANGDPVTANPQVAVGRPGNAMAWGYIVDGQMSVPVEPGDYNVVIHRGLRYEPILTAVTVGTGETIEIQADLELSYQTPGVLVIDPHSHAAPSADGGISMSHRLIVHAAHGVDVHFGTDHDHVADYRPLIEPIGLSGRLKSVLSDEVSPVLRGHFNAYPAVVDPSLPNNGAPRWYENLGNTDELFGHIREAFGDDVIIQANHPLSSSGLFSAAELNIQTGTIDDADRWSRDFDAVEVLNDGGWSSSEHYMALLSYGLPLTPVGVSDSHHYQGGVGENVTFLYAGVDDLSEFNDEVLLAAMDAHATVASHGAYIAATVDGVWAPGRIVEGVVDLDVSVYAPSWIPVQTLTLYENGSPVETVTIGDKDADPDDLSLRWSGEFSLSPSADAHYVLTVTGDSDMSPVYPGSLPWSMTSAVFVDVDGEGWQAPLGELVVE